jgi:acetyltransferase-like isoleucine patch superfamily enzyme
LPNIVIGNKALVKAGSVVTKDVPDGKVVIGNPATVVKDISKLKCPFRLIDKPY